MGRSGVLVAVLVVGTLVYVGFAWTVWRHRRADGGRALLLVVLAAATWTLLQAVEVSAERPSVQAHWGDAKYLGIVLLGPALLVFALQYTGRVRHVRRRWVGLLAVVPVVTLVLLAVPATHDLLRSVPADAPAGRYAPADAGPLFWPFAGSTYVLVLVATVVLVRGVLRLARPHPWRASLLVGSVLLPIALNALYNSGVEVTGDADPTPIGFSIAGFVLVWGFFRFRLAELVPVGRRQVFDRIPDGVLVLDLRGLVVDANPAAAALAGRSRRAMVGHPVAELLPPLAGLLEATAADAARTGSCALVADGDRLDVEVAVSPLPDATSTASGRLVVVRDVSAQRAVERRLRELLDERQATIDTLQRGLVPRHLPLVPGLDVAAALDPAESGTSNVGGDFVDLRPIGPGRWTLMIGDVVGKGAGAATLTALARHTTIALAALGWAPSRVLAAVSSAVAVDQELTDPDADPRFCTLALATLTPTDTGAEVLLSLGGHPRPLLLSADGTVREVGAPGTLLGVVDPPVLHDERLHLVPGDALVLFTDGVTETRRGDEPFGDEQLLATLSALAGRPAVDVVRSLVGAVRAWGAAAPEASGALAAADGGQPAADARDDVAVLVVAVPARAAGAGPRA